MPPNLLDTMSTVQPCGCGEQSFLYCKERTAAGSALRVRGTAAVELQSTSVGRFSPAGAGNRPRSDSPSALSAVQPCGCGEQKPASRSLCCRAGSALRVRGTVQTDDFGNLFGRFSPAGAGNSSTAPRTLAAITVQPCGCGEQAPRSSPTRCRGAPRFSPAGAGNSARRALVARFWAVQPCGCGEQGPVSIRTSLSGGSALRVRGTVQLVNRSGGFRRFSPAGAGNSAVRETSTSRRSVQPCGCGEQQMAVTGREWCDGSALRVRGTVSVQRRALPLKRFSPAGAGNSSRERFASLIEAVQPCGCGEQVMEIGPIFIQAGSALRVRGTERPNDWVEWRRRFSPAGAGNSECPTA